MNKIAGLYGGYISAIIQGTLYFFAFNYLLTDYFEISEGITKNVILVILIIFSIGLTKYFETKYAIKSLVDNANK